VLVESDPKVAINCYSQEEIVFLVDKAISKSACGKASGAYLLGSSEEKWVVSSECSSIKAMVDEFHKLNPGAPNLYDYSLQDSIKS
jgi:hypothetical protein